MNNIMMGYVIGFILGTILNSILINRTVTGKFLGQIRSIKFSDGNKVRRIIVPRDNREFATIIYALNESIYGEVISEIDKEN